MTRLQFIVAVISFYFLTSSATYAQSNKKQIKRISSPQKIVQFIFTSDVHFGLIKENFRGEKNISSAAVNAAMIEQMNRLPGMVLPADSGVNAGRKIRGIDALVITGDIANRAEPGIQSASASWAEFKKDYQELLQLKNPAGKPAALWLTPGNHDASNAIGFHRPMVPLKDPASMVGMFNLEMRPAVVKDSSHFNFGRDKVHYSRDINGIHFMFVSLWPDSAERVWMNADLAHVKQSSPVLIFTHSMPDVEARFFTNPNGQHDVNEKDKFENLVTEVFKDGQLVSDPTLKEKLALAAFLQKHPNIKAWFHGHSNWTEYYDWKAPGNAVVLHCFRADSPMKGRHSSEDETKLAFELVSIDPATKKMTVRECLWNSDPLHPEKLPEWGQSITITL